MMEEINIPPSWLTTEELEEVITGILRITPYSSELGLEVRALVLKYVELFFRSIASPRYRELWK